MIDPNATAKLTEIFPVVDLQNYNTIETCIHRYTPSPSIGKQLKYLAYRIYNAAKLFFSKHNDWTDARDALEQRYKKLEGPGLENLKKLDIQNKQNSSNWDGNWQKRAAEYHLDLLTLLNRNPLHDEATKQLDAWISNIKLIEEENLKHKS